MKNENKKAMISVIVPAYNAEQYIERMVKSILRQTYTNFELIIVNDGSTDHTADICETLRKADDRIVLKTQNNAGPSAARNNGIESARGDYITFADADDECEEDWLAEMLQKRIQTNCDMVMCNWSEIKDGKEIPYDAFPKETTVSVPEFMERIHGLAGAVWNKLFQKKIIEENHLRFDVKRKRCEDFLFIVDYILCCNTVALVSKPLYRYTVMETSLSHIDNMCDFYIEVLEGQMEAVHHIKCAKRQDCEKAMRIFVINNCFHCLILMEELEAPIRYIRQVLGYAKLFRSSMTKKQHLYFALANIAPSLFVKLWRQVYLLKHGEKNGRN